MNHYNQIDFIENINHQSEILTNKINSVHLLKQDINKKDEQIDNLKQELKLLIEKNRLQAQKISEFELKENINKSKIDKMSNQLSFFTKENGTLKEKLNEVEGFSSNLEIQLKLHEDSINLLKNKLENCSSHEKNLMVLIENLKCEQRDKESEFREKILNENKQKKATLNELALTKEEEIYDLNKIINDKINEIANLKLENEKLNENLIYNETYHTKLISCLEESLERKNSNYKQIEQQYEACQNEIRGLTSKIHSLESTIESLQKEHSLKLNDMKVDNARLTNSFSQKQTLINTSNTNNNHNSFSNAKFYRINEKPINISINEEDDEDNRKGNFLN